MRIFCSRLGRGVIYGEEDEVGEIEPDHISQEDYEHACYLYDKLGCTSFGGYTKLYCYTDVALLADVFESYRKLAMDTYGLDPAHYVFSPSMAQEAMLKTTGIEVDLDAHLFFGGGVS